MDSLLAPVELFSRDGTVAVCISLVGLLVSLLGFLRIRTVDKAIRRDRELAETFLDLPEVHFHLEQALKFLALSRGRDLSDQEMQEELRDGLQRAHFLVSSFHRHYTGARVSVNSYLLTAQRMQKRGAAREAVHWYQRALETSTRFRFDLSPEEVRQCLFGMQKCHLMRFDLEAARAAARRAAELRAQGCWTEEDIKKRGWLLGMAAALERTVRRLRHPTWTRPKVLPTRVNAD